MSENYGDQSPYQNNQPYNQPSDQPYPLPNQPPQQPNQPNQPYPLPNQPDQPYSNPQSDQPYPLPNQPVPPYGNPPYSNVPPASDQPYGYPSAGQPYGAPYYSAGVPESHPLPLSEAIRQLPSQWVKVLTKPGTVAFAQEEGKAAWNIVWVLLIILAIISALLEAVLFNFTLPAQLASNPAVTPAMLPMIKGYAVGATFASLIFVPIGFFIGAGILHLIAKAFGGRGTFLPYCYCYLLFETPLGILGGLLALIPIVGSFVAIALGIYRIVLTVFMTMAVHRMRGGRATLAVLTPVIVIILLACVLGIIIGLAIVNASHPR